MANQNKDLVLTLHGLGNHPLMMTRMKGALERHGFEVLNLGYPSCSADISCHVSSLAQQIEEKMGGSSRTLHIVGHSLGGIIGRAIMASQQDRFRFGRLVTIGSPHGSSSIARWLKTWLPSERIWGPIFQELCEVQIPNPSKFVEIGCLAGGMFNKVGFNPWLSGDNDGLVTVTETYLPGAKAHKVIFGPHFSLPFQGAVISRVLSFLSRGTF